jgi:lipopolysaccharide export system protein LptA
MARWQRRARLGLGLFAAAFAIVLWFVVGERQAPAPPPPVQQLEPNAVSEIKGGDVVQVKGAKRDIRIEFATQVLYSDGAAKYSGFKATIDDRGGRSFEITGTDARVAPEQSALDVRGNVNVRTSDGLVAKTEHATFADADGILRGDGPITFERGRTKGSGVGFQYDRSIDRLELRNQAVIDVAPDQERGGMSVRSGSAAYSRAERFLRFERRMRLEREGQIIEADAATIFLRPDRDEPEVVELRGNSTIQGAATGSALRNMAAVDINLRYAEDGRTLQHALLSGKSSIELARSGAQAGQPGQRLDGETLDITLAPDGAVSQLLGRDNIRVTIPAMNNAAAREVTSQTLTASGASGQALSQMLFENNVVYREDVPGTDPRVVQARTLNATLADAGTIETANFSGGFAFQHGALRAESAEASYNVTAGTLALRAPETAKPPSVKNDRVDLQRASVIDVTLSPFKLEASGKVQAVFAGGQREGERGTTLFNDNESIVVVCDKLTFNQDTGEGTYTGKPARVVQDSGNQIRGDVIAMNEKAGTLAATGNVITALPLAAATDKGARGNSTGSAGQFEFDDVKRRAVFTKQARLDSAQGNVHANRIELTLADNTNDLRQMNADGSVKVFVEDREASGDTLVYHPTDERYVLNGAPVRLVRGCQESAGRTLTFYRSSERVIVDGNESRAQTKGGKCPEPPR